MQPIIPIPLRHKYRRITPGQNLVPTSEIQKTKAQKRAELEVLEKSLMQQQEKQGERRKSIHSNPVRFSGEAIAYTPQAFSPAPTPAIIDPVEHRWLLFQKYPQLQWSLDIFECGVNNWIDEKKSTDANIKNYQTAVRIFRNYIDNPKEGSIIDVSFLNLQDLPENIEQALLPGVRLDLRHNQFIRVPLDLHLVDEQAKIRLGNNSFPAIEKLAILLFTSYWKKSASLYSKTSNNSQDTAALKKEKAATSLSTMEYHNAGELAYQISGVAEYQGMQAKDIYDEWKTRYKSLNTDKLDDSNKILFQRNHQYKVQRDNVTIMIEFINSDTKLKGFYDEYLISLINVFEAALSLIPIYGRPNVKAELSITQSSSAGVLTVGGFIAQASGIPGVTGIGVATKTILDFWQNYKFDEFHEKVNNFRKFIGLEDVNIHAFCETIARFITLSLYKQLQRYRNKPYQGKIIKDPEGVPSADKDIEKKAVRMVGRLLEFFAKYAYPAQQLNPSAGYKQELISGQLDVHNKKVRDFLEQAMDTFYIQNENINRPIQQREYRRVFLIFNPADKQTADVLVDTSIRLAENNVYKNLEQQKTINEFGDKIEQLTEEVTFYQQEMNVMQKSHQQEILSLQDQLKQLIEQVQNLTQRNS